jgi:tetratricopeptide (TPR) repeat protein
MKIKILTGIILLSLVACALPPKPEVQNVSGDFNVYFGQGSDFLKQKQYDRAIESLTKAVALKPEASRAQNLLGIAYFLQENFKKAEEIFLKVIALDKNFPAAYINLGNVYFMLGQVEKAESALKKTLSIAPQSISALYSLGSLLLSQGRYEQGMAYLAQGIALDPEYLDRQKDFTVSIAVAGLSSPDTFFAWARVYAGQGNAAKAAYYLGKARNAGFKDWNRLETEKEFEKVLEDPEIKRFRKTD